MKRYPIMILLLSTILISLCGCADRTPTLTPQTVSTGNAVEREAVMHNETVPLEESADSASGGSVSIEITRDSRRKVLIPDPSASASKISIILPDQEKHYCEKYEQFGELCDDCKEISFTDLSFAGFKEPVIINAFITGSITRGTPCPFQISDTKNNKKNERKATCLLLLVTNTDKTAAENKDEWQDKNYLVILDYANRRCYKIKTGYTYEFGYYHTYDLALKDLTGDKRDELIISHRFNKGDIYLEVYSFDEGGQKIKKIFSNIDHRCPNFTSFSGHLTDHYKAVLEYKDISFAKTVSLLDAGYKEKDLEVDHYPAGADKSLDDFQFIRLWKEGRLQEEGKEANTVFLYVMNLFSVKKTKNGTPQLRLQNTVMVGHRSQDIGTMYTYFQYNEKTGTMELSTAKFKL